MVEPHKQVAVAGNRWLSRSKTPDPFSFFSANRNLFYFGGYAFDPKLFFNVIIWSSNSVATVIQGGYIGYEFDKCFKLHAGYYGIPGSRSNTRDFMFLQGVEAAAWQIASSARDSRKVFGPKASSSSTCSTRPTWATR